ncbi:plastocyanin/azurin family copper-binding protein [Haladaptatus pallidirubidus]|uniref:plastocyanin/azurin family copper-binding protein n=1 Tax=Haladaptatus pallidirubidus TaxID=1008152 RepID=UPI0035E8A233
MYEEAGLSTGGQRRCWRNCRGGGTRWCAADDDVRRWQPVRRQRDWRHSDDDVRRWQPVKWKPVCGNQSEGGGGGGGGSETVTVGPGGELVFEPAELQISPGTTVEWVWESDTHNVIPTSQPDGAGWEGSGSESETFDTGHTYSHTFDTEGSYEYVCIPHESAGMTGTITVGSSGGGGGGGSAEADPEHMGVPFQAHYVGIATILMMVMSLIFTFFFLKYGESPHTSGGNR